MDLTPVYFGRLPTPPSPDEQLVERVETLTEEIIGLDKTKWRNIGNVR